MGNVVWGIPTELVERLQKESGARVFIETGTYKGGTVAKMAPLFDTVLSIEVKRDHYEQSLANVGDLENVTLEHGRSPERLNIIAPLLRETAIVWLDAHELTGARGGPNSCPLLGELAALAKSPVPPVLMIDDVHIIEAGRPGWPTLEQIQAAIDGMGFGYVTHVETDVLVAAPGGEAATKAAPRRKSRSTKAASKTAEADTE